MRRVGCPLTVHTDARGRPTSLELAGAARRVGRVFENWIETGRWWEGEPRRQFYRVEAGGVFDLSVDDDGLWRVEVVWD